ncbi:MAG: HEAT repeat domain-containing protein, partial [Chloroflexota bacterium]|nr:HEAT repeat domain-containing protein [Chloroflexota bacterium]
RHEIVANILGDIGKPSIPSLLSLLSHTDKSVRQWAVYSLGHIGEKGIELPVEPLFACLKDSDTLVRGTTAVALGRYSGGSAYKQRQVTFPIEPLLDSLKDSNVFVREQAAWALGEIGDPQALPALEKIARSDKKGLLFPSEAAKKAREAVEKIRRRNKAN